MLADRLARAAGKQGGRPIVVGREVDVARLRAKIAGVVLAGLAGLTGPLDAEHGVLPSCGQGPRSGAVGRPVQVATAGDDGAPRAVAAGEDREKEPSRQAEPAGKGEQMGPEERARQSLLEADRAFCRLSLTTDVPTAFGLTMAEGATLLRTGLEPMTGREAILAHFAAWPGGTLRWEPTFADVAASGDLGYTLGTYEYRATSAEGQPEVSTGHYVTIWRKQADGSWKFVFDTGCSGPVIEPK
jgi:ketosteroid isomerase-like protein